MPRPLVHIRSLLETKTNMAASKCCYRSLRAWVLHLSQLILSSSSSSSLSSWWFHVLNGTFKWDSSSFYSVFDECRASAGGPLFHSVWALMFAFFTEKEEYESKLWALTAAAVHRRVGVFLPLTFTNKEKMRGKTCWGENCFLYIRLLVHTVQLR